MDDEGGEAREQGLKKASPHVVDASGFDGCCCCACGITDIN